MVNIYAEEAEKTAKIPNKKGKLKPHRREKILAEVNHPTFSRLNPRYSLVSRSRGAFDL